MDCRHSEGLRVAIARAAEYIPLELMMTLGAEEARTLAYRYRKAGISENDILEELMVAVSVRRQRREPEVVQQFA